MLSKNKVFQDLPARLISAIVFGAVAVGSIFLGGLVTILFLSGCLAVLTWEIFFIVNRGNLSIFNYRLLIPISIFFLPALHLFNFYPLLGLFLVAFLSAIFPEGRVPKFLCIIYAGISVLICQELLLMPSDVPSFYHLILILSSVAASDIGGYFFGRIIGGPKIYIAISPKKTWAGSLGGLLFGVLTCVAFIPIFNYSLVEMVAIGFCLSLSAQAGDFFESFFKRRFNVKDSGFLLPGHGGFFDRLDGVLAAVPTYYGILLIY